MMFHLLSVQMILKTCGLDNAIMSQDFRTRTGGEYGQSIRTPSFRDGVATSSEHRLATRGSVLRFESIWLRVIHDDTRRAYQSHYAKSPIPV